MTSLARAALPAPWRAWFAAAAAIFLACCGPEPVKPDRCEGLSMRFLWRDADRSAAAYYEVDGDGAFRSSGGLKAMARETTYAATLDDREAARFVLLVRAVDFGARVDAPAVGALSELSVRERGDRRSMTVVGPDAPLDALRAFCAEIALRQYRDTIEAQPQAGERAR